MTFRLISVRLVLVTAAGWVALSSCQREPAAADPNSPGPPLISVPPGVPGEQPSEGASALVTTPGEVRCENVTCRLDTETCCADEAKHVGRCVPRGAPEAVVCEASELQRDCDETRDCSGAKVCCLDWGCTGPGCPTYYACVDAPCNSAEEICLPGGSCSEGFKCGATQSDLGRCQLIPKPIPCGTEQCAGDTPVCCWDSAKRTARCAKQCPNQQDNEFAFKCTSARDCGGHPCGNYGPVRGGNTFECTSIGATALFPPAMLCTETKDCVPLYSVGGTPPSGCSESPSLPPGIKQCEYDVGD